VRHHLELTKYDDLSVAISLQRQTLVDLANKNPDEQRYARVFLRRALNPKDLNLLFKNTGIEVTNVEGKVALPTSKTTLTVWFSDVQAHGADVEQALQHFEKMHENEVITRKNANRQQMTPSEREVSNDMFTSRKKLNMLKLKYVAVIVRSLVCLIRHKILNWWCPVKFSSE
jgi:hypothetical protein